MNISGDMLTAASALIACVAGYALRFYTTKNDYNLKTQINEKDLLGHLLELQKQVVTLTAQNTKLLQEVEMLRSEVLTLRTQLRGYRHRTPTAAARQRDRQPAAADIQD